MPGGSPPLPSAIITATWRVRKVCGRNELTHMHTAHCAVKRSASVCRIFRAACARAGMRQSRRDGAVSKGVTLRTPTLVLPCPNVSK